MFLFFISKISLPLRYENWLPSINFASSTDFERDAEIDMLSLNVRVERISNCSCAMSLRLVDAKEVDSNAAIDEKETEKTNVKVNDDRAITYNIRNTMYNGTVQSLTVQKNTQLVPTD